MPDDDQSSKIGGKNGAWIALLTAVIGVVGTFIATRGTTSQKRVELEAAKVTADASKELEELKAKENHLEAYMKELQSHEQNMRSLSAEQKTNSWKIGFDNKCDVPIYIALKYRALDSDDVVEGWHTINPGETTFVGYTDNRYFWYFGHTKDRKSLWHGSIPHEVSEASPFIYIDDVAFRNGWYQLPGDTKVENFREKHIDSSFGPYIVRLTCNNKSVQ
jgi:hypothetical protein